jgi:tripartite-type tricarboxylate transporter receptor subunit TctC
MISTSSWLTSAAMSKPAFDPINNVAPIVEFGYNPFVLAVHPSLPVKTTQEFIALARSRPGELAYGHSGAGSITHLATVLFVHMAKIDVLAVPYKSGGAMLPDLLSGRVDLFFDSIAAGLPYVQSGQARGIAVLSSKRSLLAPDVPTMAEAGLPGLNVDSWLGIFAPAKTPPDVIATLRANIRASLPGLKERFEKSGGEVWDLPDARLDAFVASEYQNWTKLIREIGIRLD